MSEAEERRRVIEWIKSAMAHAKVSQADLGKSIWPHDRSILGKILLNKRRAQIGELAEIAAKTDYPPYIGRSFVEPRRDPAPRLKLHFYVREWREFCEVKPAVIAKALHIDEDDLGFLEAKSHKLNVEQIGIIAKTLKVEFDSLRWDPGKLPAPEPAKTDIERIQHTAAKKQARK